ncbi:MAG: 4Fe-4S dicluster domain-containing protein [Myxococcales bacterium]|nr:4Fe-4S dicluster domain-containing protein [Myxococcales bacterium]
MDIWSLPRSRLGELIALLRARGYDVVGPTPRDGAIVYDSIESDAELPVGLGDEQSPGQYRVVPRDDGAVFGFAAGPGSFKRAFHVPEERLYRVQREGKTLRFVPEPVAPRKVALLGARGCDLSALRVLDRVLEGDRYRDERYAARRSEVLLIAVHCGSPSSTCFCSSMGTGPRAGGPWDLALTELTSGEHRFVVETGSPIGLALVRELGLLTASTLDKIHAAKVPVVAAQRITRRLEADGLGARLAKNLDHPRFAQVAERCLACANCTQVCPTCFCTTIEDFTDLDGAGAERRRRWDSCFNPEFSYIHGGPVRPSTRARYRQWMTHKLSSWHEQFGSSGCVGCGRCITWCPVGIDITEEARAIASAGTSEKAT